MKRRSVGKILALLVMLCMLVTGGAAVQAVDDETAAGSIEVNVAPFAENTALGICEVGSVINGRYVLNNAFAGTEVDFSDITEASQAQEAAVKLAEAAAERHEYNAAALDSEGKVLFKDLKVEDTLYVIFQLDNMDIVKISPMLVTLPYKNLEGDSVSAPKLNAKYEDVRIIPEKGAILLNKVDLKNNRLADADFRFEFKHYVNSPDESPAVSPDDSETDENGVYYWEVIAENLTTDNNGQIAIENLPLGTYRLIETKAPKGFEIDSTPLLAEVKASGSLKVENGIYVANEGDAVILTFENEPIKSIVPHESSSTSEVSKYEPSQPSQVSVPQPSDSTTTGDSIGKYVIIGVVVGVSLVAVILLIVLGKKKKDDDDE